MADTMVPEQVTVTDPTNGLCAILPAIQWAIGLNNDHAGHRFRRIRRDHHDFRSISKHTFPGFSRQATYAADWPTCRKVVLYALQNARMASREKQLKYDALSATEPERQRQYVECETLDVIQRVFKKHRSVRQQPFGKYRVDLYFPDAKLCVECDEEHHQWHREEDQARQEQIERMSGARFLRYNTFDESFDLTSLILVLRGILLPSTTFGPTDFAFIENFP